MPNRCPRCGRERTVAPVTPATEELHVNTELSCSTDPAYSCKGNPSRRRDPFWPRFAHPRWLSCKELYCLR
jgi:hypothetical protein